MILPLQAVKAAEDAAAQAAQAAQQAEAGGNPVDVVAKATLATQRCSQVIFHSVSNRCDQLVSATSSRQLMS